MRRLPVLALSLVGLLLAAVLPAAASSTPALSWSPCGDQQVQCATLPVPRDWSAPQADKVDLALARIPARDPATRRGTVLAQLGGPAPGLPWATDPARRARLAELTEFFDVVVFDLRGLGASAPLRCDPATATDDLGITASQFEHTAHQARLRGFAKTCGNDALLPHLAATDVARDVDAIRAALGEQRIRYFGNSYGTLVGQAYAELFPQRVQAMALDSVLDHTEPFAESMLSGARRMAGRLDRFRDWCREQRCVPGDPLRLWDRLVRTGSGPATPADIRIASMLYLFGERFDLLAEALRGDGSGFLRPDVLRPGHLQPGRAQLCLDLPAEPADFTGLAELVRRAERIEPRLSAAFVWFQARQCAGWPVPASNPPHRFQPAGLPPVLLASATEDPATPHDGAQRVHRMLPGSSLITVAGRKHGLYLSGERCVRDRVHAYLLDGTLPPPEFRCP
ncbi:MULTISPECIES: alpha/beta hydrolase [unclassified Crossiella]|uniref:alpha/beta hydrolase n=1 Tax=unclassified Crossiella TaxID=2620835 RepID=UPI0020004A0E|nr:MULTISPECIES: alpha/beta hydrolase [unclassified Crossiella]MCK2242223.1 alpha/beta hydrolase [Crossiella sp. S99.2]MCK2254746.1 alpha/beta hydrolase [Crossiella sp. S99.1]